MLGDERLVRGLDDRELEREALGIGEAQGPGFALGLDALAARRSAQKSSASSEPTRNLTVWTIPAPARPRRAPGYSKKVMSAPGLPFSSA